MKSSVRSPTVIKQYWRKTLRPNHLIKIRAIGRIAAIAAIAGIIGIENPNFVVSVIPGSVSIVFYWNIVVFVIPVMVFVTHKLGNADRHYENNEF